MEVTVSKTLIITWLVIGLLTWTLTCWSYYASDDRKCGMNIWYYSMFAVLLPVCVSIGPVLLLAIPIAGRIDAKLDIVENEHRKNQISR